MKTLEKEINASRDIVDTYNTACTEGYELYACIGRKGRYGYNGKAHYELNAENAIEFEGKLYATTPNYDATISESAESADVEGEDFKVSPDGVESPSTASNEEVDENVAEDISVVEGTAGGEIEDNLDESIDDEIVGENAVSLEDETVELKLEIDRLTAEVNEYKPLAEKYLANKDLIDSIEQRILESNDSYIEEVNTLKNRLDRIKAVVEEA